MKPMFVSYAGRIKGAIAQGWVVIDDQPPLATQEDMMDLARRLEVDRGYDLETLVFINFQRLEDKS